MASTPNTHSWSCSTDRHSREIDSGPHWSHRPHREDAAPPAATWELRSAAPNPHIGFVSVSDDAEEATVSVGEITHGHFNPYDSSLSEDAHAKWVSDAVIGFLEDLFRDRVVVWTAGPGRGGGWIVLEEGAEPELAKDVSAHLWSKPLSQTR